MDSFGIITKEGNNMAKIIQIAVLIQENWEYILSALYAVEKCIHMSKAPWNDLLIDGGKAALKTVTKTKTT